MRRSINAQYNVAAPGSLVMRVTAHMRRQMYEAFLKLCAVRPGDLILDVGATSDRTYASSNYLEAWYPHKDRIVAAGIDDAGFLVQTYPGMRFVRADGLRLPFRDSAFDVVHASAVLEHLGHQGRQTAFIAELARVARRAAFLTTPNRWFPVEVHTSLPLVHWLPAQAFRSLLSRLGHDVLACEEHLNLVGARDIRRACRDAGIASFRLSSVRLLGWPSNLLLTIDKAGGARR